MSMMDARNAATSRLDAAGMGNAGAPAEGAGKQPFAAVHYRAADQPQQSCGTCEHFDGDDGCALVAGNIDPQGVCDLFAPDRDVPGRPDAADLATPDQQAAGPPMQGA